VQYAALAALLVVDDEIEREARPAGPTRVRRLVGIADEIARIGNLNTVLRADWVAGFRPGSVYLVITVCDGSNSL
jgi:hypothetical protein